MEFKLFGPSQKIKVNSLVRFLIALNIIFKEPDFIYVTMNPA